MNQKLNLETAPSTLLLFGLAGSGKSFVGDLIAELAGWHVYHADDDLTPAMLDALNKQQPFTQQMRDDYFAYIVENIKSLQKKHPRLVITQGTYKQTHRDYLLASLTDIELICIESSAELITQRLQTRQQGISLASATALQQDFEAPGANTRVLTNIAGKNEIIRQLNAFYAASR